MKHIHHNTDFCVIGGGLAGLCAAVSAARHGLKVVIMQDRPVFGGNSSSEIRMHVCGADRGGGKGLRESGLIEEIELLNYFHNPQANFSIWDGVLFSIAKQEKNITTLLNCSCNDAQVSNDKIQSVTGWQGTSETWHTVKSKFYADCSGDSILAALAGAQYRLGREAQSEFNESIEPAHADKKTMGLSCLIQVKKHNKKIDYIPPEWISDLDYDFKDLMLTRGQDIHECENFWWLELGGEEDSIHDTDKLRDDLVSLAFGVWDYIKNKADYKADNWSMEWIGFLPGKRESRRLIGDYILTQNDIENITYFEDIVAYGGWSMDDHNPAGFRYSGQPTIFHPAPQPYGIPYRCLYSKNISNLYFAGRNISATHAALSSTRVMGTCAILGQAVGTAASIAVKKSTTPRGISKKYIADLQNILLEDGLFIPSLKKKISRLTLDGVFESDGIGDENLLNGVERSLGGINHWNGNRIQIKWKSSVYISQIRMVFDSELERRAKNMPYKWDIEPYNRSMPKSLIKDFNIMAKINDEWETLHSVKGNHHRLVRLDIGRSCEAVMLQVITTWGGNEKGNVFAFEAK